jgi:catechol O-methyltransferase
VGYEKGKFLESAFHRANPRRALELGTYLGYSALRMARNLLDGGHLYSVEWHPDNAQFARRIIDHAGMADRITILVGTLSDGGSTMNRLAQEHGFASDSVDFVFLDHDKDAYVPDLRLLLNARWLRKGAIVVADNVLAPGAPEYRAYMKEEEGVRWQTKEHKAHIEYQSIIRDLVLESTFLGEGTGSSTS